MPTSADQHESGRLPPSRLWIGVAGHRDLPDDPRLVDSVRQALDRARRLAPSWGMAPVPPGIISSLAEGADRLVAWEVLRDPEAVLEVALPLPPHEYISDFTTQASREEFHDLLGRAGLVTELPPDRDRDWAYARAGRYVNQRSDVLVAIWDGQGPRGTGGTAEVVLTRRCERRPLLLVSSNEPYELHECASADRLRDELRGIDQYNRLHLPPTALATEIGRRSRSLKAAGQDDLEPTASLGWWLPYLARAHCLADRYQRWYRWLGISIALGAGLAVATAAWILFGENRLVPLLEASLLILLCLALAVGKYLRVHQRWISCRSLVEQLRTALFLSVAGLRTGRSGGWLRRDRLGASLAWVGRAVEELWAACPRDPDPPESAYGPLRRFLASAWIEEQRGYHLQVARRYGRLDKLFTLAIYALFLATVMAALAHVSGQFEEQWSSRLTYASVVLPALAGTLESIRAQRQWLPNKERSTIAAEALRRLAKDLERAPDASAIRAVARDVALHTLEESSEWSGLMRFHDLEPR
jgi:hypothetical protein